MESIDGRRTGAVEERGAIIKTGGDGSVDPCFSSWVCETRPDLSNITEVVEGGFDYLVDMGVEGEVGVKGYAEVPALSWISPSQIQY